MPNMNIYK